MESFQIVQRRNCIELRPTVIVTKKYIFLFSNVFHEKSFKHQKIILLINFILALTYFHIASYQILKNHAIIINYESLLRGKDSLQLNRF